MTKSATRSTQQKPKTDDSLHNSFVSQMTLLLISCYSSFIMHLGQIYIVFNKKMQLLEEEKLCISQINIVS